MKRDERKIALRCAVYTRVSTDSGLEQTCPTPAARRSPTLYATRAVSACTTRMKSWPRSSPSGLWSILCEPDLS